MKTTLHAQKQRSKTREVLHQALNTKVNRAMPPRRRTETQPSTSSACQKTQCHPSTGPILKAAITQWSRRQMPKRARSGRTLNGSAMCVCISVRHTTALHTNNSQFYAVWAGTIKTHEVDRSYKRLKTQEYYVQAKEQELEGKRQHCKDISRVKLLAQDLTNELVQTHASLMHSSPLSGCSSPTLHRSTQVVVERRTLTTMERVQSRLYGLMGNCSLRHCSMM